MIEISNSLSFLFYYSHQQMIFFILAFPVIGEKVQHIQIQKNYQSIQKLDNIKVNTEKKDLNPLYVL